MSVDADRREGLRGGTAPPAAGRRRAPEHDQHRPEWPDDGVAPMSTTMADNHAAHPGPALDDEVRAPDGRVYVDRYTPPRPALATADAARVAGSVAGDLAVGFGVIVLGLIGFYNSFFTVAHAMEGAFPGRAWTVPLAIDVGIAVFTGLDLRMAARDTRTTWVRLFPWFLNSVTVYLNVAEQDTLPGRVAHGALPILWIAAVEGVVLLVNRRQAHTKADRVPVARWLLAPGPTLLLWRRMRMWNVSSYAQANDTEANRRIVRSRLAQRYGRRWKRTAPAETVELYRQGRLVAPDVVVEVAAVLPATDAGGQGPGTGTGTGPGRDRAPSRNRPGKARRPRPRAEGTGPVTVPAEALADARVLVAEHFDGQVPGRDRLVPLLRSEHGHRLPSAVAAELMRQLKAAPAPVGAESRVVAP